MAKGDTVTVIFAIGDGTLTKSIVASKAGRTVSVDWPAARAKDQSVHIVERTRNGGPAGHLLRVRLDTLVALEEVRLAEEPRPRKAKPKDQPVPGQVTAFPEVGE